MDGVTVPTKIAISSKLEHNSIEEVRRRLRSNKINHLKFDPTTEGEMGEKYFAGVYEPNNRMHILENQEAKEEPRNYYAYISKIRGNDEPTKKKGKKPNQFVSRFSKGQEMKRMTP
jgi:hypothetical protein